MSARLIARIVLGLAALALGKRLKRQGLAKEIGRRLNLALSVALGGYLLLAALRLIGHPPAFEHLAALAAVAAVLGLVWLALRLVLALSHSRRL